MTKTIAALLLAIIGFTGFQVSNTFADGANHHRTHYDPTRKPCVYSDGPGPCFWDAAKRGNHRGASYYIDSDGWVHYVDGVTFKLQSK